MTRTAADLWAGDEPPDPVNGCSVTLHCEEYPTEQHLSLQREWIERMFPLFPVAMYVRLMKRGGYNVRWTLDIDPNANVIVAEGISS